MAALIISLQITFMHRVMSNQSSQEWQLNSNTPASVEHERKMAASQVFANPHHNSEMTVDEQMGINRTMLQEIQADPIPDVRDEATNQLLFNPEEFRTGDRTKYVNRPSSIIVKNDDASQINRPIPEPIGLQRSFASTNSKNPNDVVISIHSSASKTSKRDFTWFVGSLRNTGYDGRIIMGIHPETPKESVHLLEQWDVTIYFVEHEDTCEGDITKHKDVRGRQVKCFKSVESLATERGRYELARRWLHACKECTGKVLLEFDSPLSFFQSNPFDAMSTTTTADLMLFEELAPHTDPYYGSTQYPRRHLSLSTSRNYNGSINKCYKKPQTFGANRPILVSRAVSGTRNGLLRYLTVLVDEFHQLNTKPDCHVPSLSDVWIMNYLYYSGRFGNSNSSSHRNSNNGDGDDNNINIITMPYGTGVVAAVGRPCTNVYTKPNHSQLDIVKIDFEKTGYIVNNFVEDGDDPLRVVPLIHEFDACEKWIKMFIKQHPEINGNHHAKPDEHLELLQHAILQSVKRLPPSEKENPMETSYQRATVVQQAPWFKHQKYCKETCCAQAVAVSLKQDSEHLITSVDGMDLADVALLGHRKKEYLDWAISDFTNDIIPCLRPGTIIYADHEGGGWKRFNDYYRKKLTKPFVLITGGTDGGEPWGPADLGRKMLENDPLLINWYGINPMNRYGANHPKFQMMFLGLSAGFDHQKHLSAYQQAMNYTNPFAGIHKKRFTESYDLQHAKDTTNLLFVKFGINEHSQHRKRPFDMACNGRTQQGAAMDEISCSHSGRKYHATEIYDAARHYLFGLSPPGNGKDCYRTYEFLYLGIIPIVARNSEYDELYKGLPIIQLNPNWDYTQEQLVTIMKNYIQSDEFQNNDFHEGWNKLFLSYWRHRVLTDSGRHSEIVQDENGNEYYTSWSYTKYSKPYSQTWWPPKDPMSEVEKIL